MIRGHRALVLGLVVGSTGSFAGLGCTPGNSSADAGPQQDAQAPDAPAMDTGEGGSECVDGGTGVWDSQPTKLDDDMATGNNRAINPHIGFDGMGDAIAVWEQADSNGIYSVWSSERTPDGAWSTPKQISTTPATGGGGTTLVPQIAVSADGSAVAVWQQPAGTGAQNVWANRYAPGIGWGGEVMIESAAVDGGPILSANPIVTMNAKGDAIVAWEESDGQTDNGTPAPDFATQVYANRYSAGTWGGPAMLSRFGVNFSAPNTHTQNSRYAQAALDDAGNALVVWDVTVENTGGKVQAARFDAGSTKWGTATYIDSCASNCATSSFAPPPVAFDAKGNAIAAYDLDNGTTGGTRGTWAALYSASGGAWSAPQTLDPMLSGSSDDRPRLAVAPNGDAVAVWQATGNSMGVYADVYRGGTWSGAAQLDDGSGGRPTVAMDGAGNATVIWDNQGAVFARSVAAGSTTFDAQKTLAMPQAGATDAQIAFASTGCTRAIAVFGNSGGVWALVER